MVIASNQHPQLSQRAQAMLDTIEQSPPSAHTPTQRTSPNSSDTQRRSSTDTPMSGRSATSERPGEPLRELSAEDEWFTSPHSGRDASRGSRDSPDATITRSTAAKEQHGVGHEDRKEDVGEVREVTPDRMTASRSTKLTYSMSSAVAADDDEAWRSAGAAASHLTLEQLAASP